LRERHAILGRAQGVLFPKTSAARAEADALRPSTPRKNILSVSVTTVVVRFVIARQTRSSAVLFPSSLSSVRRMHPRNRHRHGYDFPTLVTRSPALGRFVGPTGHGGDSIDFADPAAVLALNRALLQVDYGIVTWNIPPGYLCPPVPGRADYLHHVADMLAAERAGEIPRGPDVRVLDVGVGANCIYPIIGRCEYGWKFVGAESDPVALRNAEAIIQANPALANGVTLRPQRDARLVFRGVVQSGEHFDVTVCNPPFHASPDAAAAGTRRKLRNLAGRAAARPTRNFGGRNSELWCPGGELAFVRRMIRESAGFGRQCRWFTTLVSQRAHLPAIHAALRQAAATDVRTIEMAQGQKKSRIVAWRM
jgi:23S rRNA (adenine1618-N6)-methyltransferase